MRTKLFILDVKRPQIVLGIIALTLGIFSIVWTVPVGLGLAKVVKLGRLPVKLQLAVQYMPVHPRISGQEWNVQVSITPVLPKLIKGVLFQ
jgi:hypothetical protein